MATPPVLYPQTSEQRAVARRTEEIGAGVMLNNDSVQGIRFAVQEVLNNTGYSIAAKNCSTDFRSCIGTTGAAEFIENAPHPSEGVDVLSEINKANGKFQFIYWLSVIIMIALIGVFLSWKYVWIIQIVAGILSIPIGRSVQKKRYDAIIKKINEKK
jgi:macrolide glycosyltransferase